MMEKRILLRTFYGVNRFIMTKETYRTYITTLEKQLKEDREHYELGLINDVSFAHLENLKERINAVSVLLVSMNKASHRVFKDSSFARGELF
jgi:hypothetical protein